MLFSSYDYFEVDFQRNLNDWYAGGPSPSGWTRDGDIVIPVRQVRLTGLTKMELDVDEILAKNAKETERWHLAFLANHSDPERTLYWDEYLMPRYNRKDAYRRIETFLELFEDMKNSGYNRLYPAWVADVESLGLGFKYFRFNGCHRTCCAKTLGIRLVPVYCFSITCEVRVS